MGLILMEIKSGERRGEFERSHTSLFLLLISHKTPGNSKVGVLVRFCTLWPRASGPGSLAWFGHLSGRTVNVVTEDIPSTTGPASWYNPTEDAFV